VKDVNILSVKISYTFTCKATSDLHSLVFGFDQKDIALVTIMRSDDGGAYKKAVSFVRDTSAQYDHTKKESMDAACAWGA